MGKRRRFRLTCLTAALAMVAVPGGSAVKTKAARWDRTSLSGQLESMDDQAADLQSQNDELQNQMTQNAAQLAADAQASAAGDAEAKSRLDAETAALAKQQAAMQNNQSLIAQTQTAKQALTDATGGTEAGYRSMLSGNAGGVYAQRAALDASAQTINNGGGPCGDYPPSWCAAPPDSGIRIGGKGFLNRECVAYAAYERWKHGQPFATGNAGDWPSNSQNPTVGSVAIWNRGMGGAGAVGHVAYVTAVSANSITISEFNWKPFLYDSRTIMLNGRGWPSRFWN